MIIEDENLRMKIKKEIEEYEDKYLEIFKGDLSDICTFEDIYKEYKELSEDYDSLLDMIFLNYVAICLNPDAIHDLREYFYISNDLLENQPIEHIKATLFDID